jgi:hypothetical protein
MFRSLALASVASLFALTIGCSGSPDGATAVSTDDALSAKSTGYFLGNGPGVTGGVSVSMANAKTTACPDGSKKSACAVLGVDFGKLALDSATETKLSNGFRDGYVVVHGKLDSKSSTLVADKAWLGASKADAQELDQLYLVNLEVQNAECTAGSSCSGPHYRQATVNDSSSKGVLEINDVSLDGPGSQSEVAQGEDEMNLGAEGLLVLGHDVTLISNHNAETTRTLLATNFFLPVTAGSNLTCASVDCAQGMHCEMKGINGGAIPVCIQN